MVSLQKKNQQDGALEKPEKPAERRSEVERKWPTKDGKKKKRRDPPGKSADVEQSRPGSEPTGPEVSASKIRSGRSNPSAEATTGVQTKQV